MTYLHRYCQSSTFLDTILSASVWLHIIIICTFVNYSVQVFCHFSLHFKIIICSTANYRQNVLGLTPSERIVWLRPSLPIMVSVWLLSWKKLISPAVPKYFDAGLTALSMNAEVTVAMLDSTPAGGCEYAGLWGALTRQGTEL